MVKASVTVQRYLYPCQSIRHVKEQLTYILAFGDYRTPMHIRSNIFLNTPAYLNRTHNMGTSQTFEGRQKRRTSRREQIVFHRLNCFQVQTKGANKASIPHKAVAWFMPFASYKICKAAAYVSSCFSKLGRASTALFYFLAAPTPRPLSVWRNRLGIKALLRWRCGFRKLLQFALHYAVCAERRFVLARYAKLGERFFAWGRRVSRENT